MKHAQTTTNEQRTNRRDCIARRVSVFKKGPQVFSLSQRLVPQRRPLRQASLCMLACAPSSAAPRALRSSTTRSGTQSKTCTAARSPLVCCTTAKRSASVRAPRYRHAGLQHALLPQRRSQLQHQRAVALISWSPTLELSIDHEACR